MVDGEELTGCWAIWERIIYHHVLVASEIFEFLSLFPLLPLEQIQKLHADRIARRCRLRYLMGLNFMKWRRSLVFAPLLQLHNALSSVVPSSEAEAFASA